MVACRTGSSGRGTATASGPWPTCGVEYRICRYNPEAHDGVHVHAPADGEAVASVPSGAVSTPRAAERLVRWYARDHAVFDVEDFLEVVNRWRSGSSDG